ncbi:interleukin-6 [Pempheris klunzingeri]|uniref:interleukin-6 n=1 Tax=Pempheris klunzingeri TaxID=3127111 RepID=UPI00397EDA85
MPSKLDASLLSALMLAALLLCALGAPLEDAPADNPAGDPSGEGEETPSDLVSAFSVWTRLLGATGGHQAEFEREFHHQIKYNSLQPNNIPSLPANCPKSNFSKEAYLHRLIEGLLRYMVLLKYVEKEYPSSLIPSQARSSSGCLISMVKDKMRNPGRVTALTSSQEEQLLKTLDSPNTFERMMTAHRILYHLHFFILDCKREISKKEKARSSMAKQTLL